MSRRHVKEYRPDEALTLISADRERKPLQCPCCGAITVGRSPLRPCDPTATFGRVTLTCASCERVVSYIDRAGVMQH
ncbi:MAG TPA: hypothetical protein VGM77_03695 [Gemmatimonadales bacterium]|jgi:hypothetical protein